jgi:hypothetical protein
MISSTYPRGTIGSVVSLLAATLYQILIETTSSGISYQLRDIYFICRCCWTIATYEWKAYNGKIEIIPFVAKFQFLTTSHCQFRGVGQGMKQTYRYLWTPRKFYGRHHDLVDRYGIFVSRMTTDMFHLS